MHRVETRFDAPGTLTPPGPIGRIVRLALAALVLVPAITWPLFWQDAVRVGWPADFGWYVGLPAMLWVVPNVVNIGFGVNWRQAPRYVFGAILGIAFVVGSLVWGVGWTPVFGLTVLVLGTYTFGHLGVSFLLAAITRTPGCEMRALPDLRGRVSGAAAREHYCPGMLTPLDRWEHERRTGG